MGRGRPVGQSDVLEPEEIKALLGLPDRRTRAGMRDYIVLIILSNTPMRKGELIGLQVKSLVDEGQKSIIYQGLKKRSARPYWLKIPISDEVHGRIVRYIQMEYPSGEAPADAPLVYTIGKHGPYQKCGLTPKSVDGIVAKYVRLAGIKKRITPHSFRASYLTLRAAGRDPASLMALSGHANLESLMPYLRASEQRKKEAALAFSFV